MDTEIGKIQDQDHMAKPEVSNFKPEWLEGLKLRTISFDGNKDITNPLLEDLIS